MAVTPPAGSAALSGIRVIDLTDELAAYASRLLVDLGAEVLRVEPPSGSSTRRSGPIVAREELPGVSMFDRWVNAGKRSVTLDADEPEGRALLERLLADAHLVIESPAPALEAAGITPARLREINPGLSRIIVTPFGLGETRPWTPADDLLVMAEGGLLHLGGYPDAGPVAAYGGQSRFAASIFAAVAAITAVLQQELTGEGGIYDVSAQECVAQALEDSAATYSLTGRVREAQGDRPREAGTGVYACRDGFVSMVAGRLGTAKAWVALVDWLNEAGDPGAEELRSERWGRFEFRQSDEGVETFTRIFEAFARDRDKQDLYRDAQSRKIALSPVSTVVDLLSDAQLASRGFFVELDDAELDRRLVYPRAPYRLSATPASDPRAAPRAGEDNVSVYVDGFGLSNDEYASLVERGIV